MRLIIMGDGDVDRDARWHATGDRQTLHAGRWLWREGGHLLLYSALLLLVLLLGTPFWLLRMVRNGRYRRGLSQRLGLLPAGLREMVAGRPVIWLHAVSVGEILAATELIRGLQSACVGWVVAISTTTETAQRLARQRFPELPVFYLPLDFAFAVRRYLRALQPRMLLLMESEFWPNLLRESGRAGAVIAVANARISDRSFPRYLRLRRLWQPILRPIAAFLAQGEETAARLRAIGVPAQSISVTGNLKYDLRLAPRGEIYERLRQALPDGASVLVAGSTLEGEEELLLGAWAEVIRTLPAAVLVLAPRHPDRFARVATLVEAHHFPCCAASQLSPGDTVHSGTVVLLDTIGDLSAIYALGDVAFVGGSLVPAGGHNPLEPARFGVPVLTGASTYNFREVVDAMTDRSGIRVLTHHADLADELLRLLRQDDEARMVGAAGETVFRAQAGATARSIEHLLRLLGSRSNAFPADSYLGRERTG